MITIPVKASRCYDVQIGRGILSSAGEQIRTLHPKAKKAHIVTDFHVYEFYREPIEKSLTQAGFKTVFSTFLPGEESKGALAYFTLLDDLAEEQHTRSDIIIALGGGVIGDLAGFAAATYLRGVPYVQIPTTLLAMVDSSVGGKTAINLDAGKNLAGAFYQPSLVLCDTDMLGTLPDTVYRGGMAEVIKYGMLGSRALLENLSAQNDLDIAQIIAQSVSMKRDIVEKDEFDLGQRMLLNFGHTIGHAIERLSDYTISHGLAVAIGMAVDTRAAIRADLSPPECLAVLESLLKRFKLPNQTDFSPEEIYHAALGDKKRSSDAITIVIPRALGKSSLETIPTDELLPWIERGLHP